MNLKRTILENKIRNIVKNVLREASFDTNKFIIEYYETWGGLSDAGRIYESFESAINEGKRKIKDGEFTEGLEYVGVIGRDKEPRFAVLYCEEIYLERLKENKFKSAQDFEIFKKACQKVVDTEKPVKGKFT